MTKKKEDPRVRMKEVRADVRAFVEGKAPEWMQDMPHLGEYPKNMEDAKRTIIALQDMLERSTERHQKASDHILNLRRMEQFTSEISMEAVKASLKEIEMRDYEIKRLKNVIEKGMAENHEIHKALCEANSRAAETENRYMQTLTKLDAAMMTLKTSLNGD